MTWLLQCRQTTEALNKSRITNTIDELGPRLQGIVRVDDFLIADRDITLLQHTR